ncbi:RNA polymerase sigma factor [Aquisphaera giovannonii]|uniref:RNA polymerase sigma factor n=1 Tax=Aquisphaera giovannonii TaxID=406548 RepID=A0A5B9VXX9_9BACT|nr:sigma-70 family RNA polymerase sigma factor [Aquisphaera giovannonii]QEH32999.1 RNA polymerase sigma factor [Aquisphaera giovannonii]
MTGDDDDEALVARADGGDPSALAELFERHRRRLRHMVQLRLDPRLRGRVDASDVLQEAYLDLVRQFPAYREKADLPPFLWLRLLTGRRLLRVHRRHLGAAIRDAGREVSIHGGAAPGADSGSLAEHLVGRLTTASRAFDREERRRLLQRALDSLDPLDREVLALRHFEGLTNGEAAAVLGLSKTAACNRYVRALARLQEATRDVPGLLDEPAG